MTDITVTLGPRPELDAEERRQRALRAQEVLSSAGWVFDEVVSSRTRELLDTQPDDAQRRTVLHMEIYALLQLKGHLLAIVRQQAYEDKQNERKHRAEPPADHE